MSSSHPAILHSIRQKNKETNNMVITSTVAGSVMTAKVMAKSCRKYSLEIYNELKEKTVRWKIGKKEKFHKRFFTNSDERCVQVLPKASYYWTHLNGFTSAQESVKKIIKTKFADFICTICAIWIYWFESWTFTPSFPTCQQLVHLKVMQYNTPLEQDKELFIFLVKIRVNTWFSVK